MKFWSGFSRWQTCSWFKIVNLACFFTFKFFDSVEVQANLNTFLIITALSTDSKTFGILHVFTYTRVLSFLCSEWMIWKRWNELLYPVTALTRTATLSASLPEAVTSGMLNPKLRVCCECMFTVLFNCLILLYVPCCSSYWELVVAVSV